MGRLFRIIKGWFLRLIGSAEDANPRAILEAEIADFHKASAQYNQNLAKQAGMIEEDEYFGCSTIIVWPCPL